MKRCIGPFSGIKVRREKNTERERENGERGENMEEVKGRGTSTNIFDFS